MHQSPQLEFTLLEIEGGTIVRAGGDVVVDGVVSVVGLGRREGERHEVHTLGGGGEVVGGIGTALLGGGGRFSGEVTTGLGVFASVAGHNLQIVYRRFFDSWSRGCRSDSIGVHCAPDLDAEPIVCSDRGLEVGSGIWSSDCVV